MRVPPGCCDEQCLNFPGYILNSDLVAKAGNIDIFDLKYFEERYLPLLEKVKCGNR